MEELFGFETQEADLLLSAIKSDDRKAFETLTLGGRYFSLCFGRFPVLSLCYLFSARKIVAKFEKQLIHVDTYTPVPEDDEAYARFKRAAGRALRLYTDGTTVEPVEMLAVLGMDLRLKRLLKEGYGDNSREKLSLIYSLSSGRHAEDVGGKFKIQPKPLAKAEKIILVLSAVICAAVIALSGVMINYIDSFPTGDENNPVVISSDDAFQKAILEGGFHSVLNCDVYADYSVSSFDGTLDGNGHTLYVSGLDGAYIKTLNGTIKNLNVVITDEELSAAEVNAFFVKENRGELNGVSLTLTNCKITVPSSVDETATDSRYIGALTAVNYNTVNACNVNLGELIINGAEHVNTCFGTVAAQNGGTVKDCATTSSVTAYTADIGGIVGENTVIGTVDNCRNGAAISQTSSSESWSPNVGGVVLTNNGTVSNCLNAGELYASSTAEVRVNVYLGGVVCNNNAAVSHSKNTAALSASGGELTFIFCGGVVAQSVGSSAGVNYCGSEGDITASAEGSSFAFVGGVVGYNEGGTGYSFFTASIVQSGASLNFCAGGVVACSDYTTFYYTAFSSRLYYYSNCYVAGEKYTVGVGYYLTTVNGAGTVTPISGELYCTSYASPDALHESEVYWA